MRVSQHVYAHPTASQPNPKPVTREREVYRADFPSRFLELLRVCVLGTCCFFDCCHNFSVLVHLNSLQKENIVCFILRRHTNAKSLFRLCR